MHLRLSHANQGASRLTFRGDPRKSSIKSLTHTSTQRQCSMPVSSLPWRLSRIPRLPSYRRPLSVELSPRCFIWLPCFGLLDKSQPWAVPCASDLRTIRCRSKSFLICLEQAYNPGIKSPSSFAQPVPSPAITLWAKSKSPFLTQQAKVNPWRKFKPTFLVRFMSQFSPATLSLDP